MNKVELLLEENSEYIENIYKYKNINIAALFSLV